MPIDLYGSKPIDITQDVAQKAIAAKSPTGQGSSAQGAFGSSMKYYGQKLGEAIDAWGMDTVLDWKNKGAMMEQKFRDELEEMRRKADMARQTNDMEMYKVTMQRILFDKQMLAYADNLKKNNVHSLVAGLVQLVGQIGGGYLGSKDFGSKKPMNDLASYYQYH
jgi:hypothetical protein